MKKILAFLIVLSSLLFITSAKEDRTAVESAASASPLHNATTKVFSKKDLPKGGGEKVIFNNVSSSSAAISLTVWTKKSWSQAVMTRVGPGQKDNPKMPKDIENYSYFALTSIDKKPFKYSFTAQNDDLVINIMD